MITLRYHIVSIVAVFLALGIGLALGSTFISSAVVSRLESEIDDLHAERDELRQQASDLGSELETVVRREQEFEQEALPLVAGGRLDGNRIVMFAVEGVHEDTVAATAVALAGSAGQFAGTLWVTDRFDLTDERNRADLAALLGSSTNDALLRRAFQRQMSRALLPDEPEPVGSAVGDVITEVSDELLAEDRLQVQEPPPPAQRDTIITGLVEAGFLRFDAELASTEVPLEGLVEFGTRFVMVSAADADVPPDDFMLPLLQGMAEEVEPVPAVAADATELLPDGPGPQFVEAIMADPVLTGAVSTQDNLREFWGILGTTTALDQYPRVGHYGVGEPADSLLPPP
jgi:Copper transport outer membrane protein, MctB